MLILIGFMVNTFWFHPLFVPDRGCAAIARLCVQIIPSVALVLELERTSIRQRELKNHQRKYYMLPYLCVTRFTNRICSSGSAILLESVMMDLPMSTRFPKSAFPWILACWFIRCHRDSIDIRWLSSK